MKLVGIFIVWDDFEILKLSIESLRPHVDGAIVIWSAKSNSGELSNDQLAIVQADCLQVEPATHLPARANETHKRNKGLEMARKLGYTHFLMLDSDEFYTKEAIDIGKKYFIENDSLRGLICDTKLYFKTPELVIADPTRVPFIHKLTENIRFTKNYEYPFSHDEGTPRIDPTRTMNLGEMEDGWLIYLKNEVFMHHMSYIRRDIRKKIRNSAGLKVAQFKDALIEDYRNAQPGYKSKFFNLTMNKAENIFNLPEMVDITI